jgi:hypothetical protein
MRIAACLLLAAAFVMVASASSPSAYVVEIDGERHVLLNQAAQERIVGKIEALEAEVARLKKGCPKA